MARDAAFALPSREPAVMQPVQVPALEAAAEYRRGCVCRAADNVNCPMACAKAIEHGRVGEVLEEVVVHACPARGKAELLCCYL